VEFARLWGEGAVGPHVSARKTVVHPQVGEVICDCDVLTVPGCDIRLVVYTVAAGSPDAKKLEFLRVTNGLRAEGTSPSGPGLVLHAVTRSSRRGQEPAGRQLRVQPVLGHQFLVGVH
jgi:hypothetical protein